MTGNELADLIDKTREVNQWSDEDVARRARAAGHQLSKSHLSRIRIQSIHFLSPDMTRALAAGLGLSVTSVLRASLVTLGLPAGDVSTSIEQAVAADPLLTEATKRTILAAVRASRLRGDTLDVSHTTPAGSATETTQRVVKVSGTGAHSAPVNADEGVGVIVDELAGDDSAGVKRAAQRRAAEIRAAATAKTAADDAARPVEHDNGTRSGTGRRGRGR